MSLIDRLNGLDLPQINDECQLTLDRVLVGGPIGVGKTDMLRQLTYECEQCNVSMVDYKMDRCSLIRRRSSNMIYEHTDQCPVLRRIASAYERRIDADACKLDTVLRDGRFFEECCLAQAPQSIDKMILLIDTRQRYFDKFDNPVRAYLQCVAYLSMIHESYLYPFMKAFLLYDPGDLDPLLDSTGVYRLVCRLQATNHNVRLVDNLETVKRGIVSAHCQRYYSSLVEEFNA